MITRIKMAMVFCYASLMIYSQRMTRRNSKSVVKQDRKSSKTFKQETFDHLFSGGDTSLSELSEEHETEPNPSQTNTPYELHQVFPLDLDLDNIKIDLKTYTDKVDKNSREITFKALFKTLDIWCTCVMSLNNTNYFDEMNQYEWEMSGQLMPCRYTATYLRHFKANRHALINEIAEDTSKGSVWYFLKPYFQKGTLGEYWMQKRKSNTSIEPLYVLQIAISLFSTIADAHSLRIGLVDISMDTLFLGMDGIVYFSGFKSSLNLQEDDEIPPWINFDLLPCPVKEKVMLKKSDYKQETDVYLASFVILRLMLTPSIDLSTIIPTGNDSYSIPDSYIDHSCLSILPGVKQGLELCLEDRPSAATMLRCFESMRYNALG